MSSRVVGSRTQLAIDTVATVWNRAQPRGRTGHVTSPSVDTAETIRIAVLRGLAAGATDQEVARRVHVSTRPVHRVVDDSEVASGARTRFAASVAARRLGLVDPAPGDRPAPDPARRRNASAALGFNAEAFGVANACGVVSLVQSEGAELHIRSPRG